MDDILVSVLCCTYNQCKYISDAIEGFLSQITSFNFEILIHDDCSNDGTKEILQKYEKQFPDRIRCIYETENKYSKGVNINDEILLPKAKGKYIAICEGDDFWIDNKKLQKQFDIMEKHQEIDLCAHPAYVVNSDRNKIIDKMIESDCDTIFKVDQIIEGGGGFLPTNSLFIRKTLFDRKNKFYEFLKMDYTKQIKGSLRGGVYYLKDIMSCYRWMADGSITLKISHNAKDSICFYKKIIDMLTILNEETNFAYSKSISKIMNRYEFGVYVMRDDYKNANNAKYREYFKSLKFKEKLKFKIKLYFPFTIKIKRKLFGN